MNTSMRNCSGRFFLFFGITLPPSSTLTRPRTAALYSANAANASIRCV